MKFLRTENADRVYGPTGSGREYKCVHYHRNSRNPHKNSWEAGVTEQEESDFFEEAERQTWHDAAHAFWWTSVGAVRKIGTKGQRLAYFPPEPNGSVPAHGYPVTTYRSTAYRMDEAVIAKMEASGHIDDLVAKKLRNQKL